MKAQVWVDDWIVAFALVRCQDEAHRLDRSPGANFLMSSSLLGTSLVQSYVSLPILRRECLDNCQRNIPQGSNTAMKFSEEV